MHVFWERFSEHLKESVSIYILIVFFTFLPIYQSKVQAKTFKEDEEVYMAVVISEKEAAIF